MRTAPRSGRLVGNDLGAYTGAHDGAPRPRTRGEGQVAMQVTIIGAPSSAGAYAPGQEKAPAAFRRHGLSESLQRAGIVVSDAGDVPGFRWRPDLERPKAMNLDAVRLTAQAVAQQVAEALRT